MLTPEQYIAKRLPQLLAKGFDAPAALYLAKLEHHDLPQATTTLQQLAQTPRWEGKQILLSGSNTILQYTQGRWRLLQRAL
jgi:hypothetical protein